MKLSARMLASVLLLAGTALLAQPVVDKEKMTIAAPEADRRGIEQTYLTYPEWFLVFSSAEYADWVKHDPPETFPFVGHVRQFWRGYGYVDAATRAYPRNDEYHTMIRVIGASTTLEYSMRVGYESLIGRLSNATAVYGTTAEDRLAAQVAQEYVDFIRLRPWYEFDFGARLKQVWSDTGWWGDGALRKWERKYALTTEYGAKALYGWAIGMATHASYGVATDNTVVALRDVPTDVATQLPLFKVLGTQADASVLASLPRYEPFTHYAQVLSAAGAHFVEIAGNRGAILVTAWAPVDWQVPAEFGNLLFAEPIMTQPQFRRVALQVPVAALDRAVATLSQPPFKLEHVFDY
ncbi:MAG: hypothetical protein ABI411_04955 [Tahibacter sp.]